MRPVLYCLTILIAVSSCSEGPSFGPVDSEPQQISNTPPTYDEKLRQIAGLEPTFAGIVNSNGEIVVLVTDPAKGELARAAAVTVLNDARLNSATIRVVTRSFMELYQLAQRALPVKRQLGYVSFDINESENRLIIRTVNETARNNARAFLLGIGLPDEAFRTEVGPRPQFAQTLQTRHRPMFGGIRLAKTSTSNCTLGFHATYYPGGNPVSVFATNAHCTASRSSTTAQSSLWQNLHGVAADLAGTEAYESGTTIPYNDPRCDRTILCKYSDIVLMQYASGASGMGYYIGKTTQRSNALDASLNLAGYLYVANEVAWPLAGDTVDKVGQRTGWTYGPVRDTCIDVPIENIEYLCQYTADAPAGGGDSGAAVFYYTAGSDGVNLVGQLFATDGDLGFRFYFSSWNNIQSEMGNIKVSDFVP